MLLRLLLCLLLAAALSACADRSSSMPAGETALTPAAVPAQQSRLLPGLPAPAELAQTSIMAPPRTGSYVPADLLREAEALSPSLPKQHVSATAGGAQFSPDWTSTGGSGGLAFAVYDFTFPQYNGDNAIYYNWITAPDQSLQTYLGFANWDTNRWDWFAADDSGRLQLDNLNPFTFNSFMLVCLLQTGQGESELDYLRIGSLPPEPALNAYPLTGLAPLTVNFDASGSTDPDGSVAEYKWDPEGDGNFSASTGTDPHFSFEYSAAGSYSAALRVYDNKHVYAAASTAITASDTANFSIGAPAAAEQAQAAVVTTDGHLMLFGKDDASRNALMIKVSPAGELDSAQSWGSTTDYFEDAALAEDGFVYAVGLTYTYGPGGEDDGNALLQKWSQAGELVWSRAIGMAGVEESFYAMVLASDAIYVCGKTRQDSFPDWPLVARLDYAGNVVWAHTLLTPNSGVLTDIAYHSGEAIGSTFVKAVGNYYNTDQDALLATFSNTSELLSCQGWGAAATVDTATSIVMSGFTIVSTYVGGRMTVIGGDDLAFVSRPGKATALIGDPQGDIVVTSMLSGGLGSYTVALLRGGSPFGMALAGLDSDLALTQQMDLSATPEGSNTPLILQRYGSDGLLLSGYQHGALPVQGNLTLTDTASAEAWENLSLSLGSPVMSSVETATNTTNLSGLALNRAAADSDMFVYLLRP